MTEIEQLLQQQLTSLQRQRSIEISEWRTQLDILLQQQQEQQNEISSLEQQLNALSQQHEQQQTLFNELLELQKQQQEHQSTLQQRLDVQERQHFQQQQNCAQLSDLCSALRITVEQLFTDCERLSSNASSEAQQALQVHRQQTDEALRLVVDGLIELEGSVNGLVERLPL